MKSHATLRLRPPSARVKPSKSWGVAWFGHGAQNGICRRCQQAGLVYQGYNGGQPMGTFCAGCKSPVLRSLP